MLCVQCGTDNPEGSKYCVSCNAVIPMAAPTGNPVQSNLDLDEMVDYPVPETHYQSPVLQHLAWGVHEFIDEGGELDPILEAYDAFREIFEGFAGEIPKIKEAYYEQQAFFDEDPMPSQIKYSISQAERLYKEGETIFENYFDLLESLDEDEEFPDPQPLVDGTKKWLECNDSVCVTFDMIMGRQQFLDEYLEEVTEILEEKKAEEAAAGGSAPAAPADSTDLA